MDASELGIGPAGSLSGAAVECEPPMVSPARFRPRCRGWARVLFHLARFAQQRSPFHRPSDLARTTDERSYRGWRREQLRSQLVRHFDAGCLHGRDVIDFGCGTGELSRLILDHAPRSVLGVDRSEPAVRDAERGICVVECGRTVPVRFCCNRDGQELPVPNATADLILCFDVLEHIGDVAAVAGEWHRVLRPGGRVWIWWSPWRSPYGHHLESLIPLPWAHLVFSEATLCAACADLYDDPAFVPRKWDRDPLTGAKKPNKWRGPGGMSQFLNRLTRRGFEKTVRAVGLRIVRREVHGFGGSWPARATRLLRPLPILGECFVSFFVYELERV